MFPATFRSALLGFLLFTLSATASPEILRYTDHEPYGDMRTTLINNVFFAAIEKASHGRLKVEPHWGGETAISYHALATISEGKKADMGIVVPEYTARQLPLHQIFKSYAIGPNTGAQQVEFFRRVYSELPAFSAELESNNLVNLQFFLGYPVGFFAARPLKSITDLRGTTWRTASFWHQAYLNNTGAKTISLPWNHDITTALQDGRLDGLMVNLDSGYAIHAEHTAPNILFSPSLWLGHVYLLTINKNKWDSLEERDREAIRRAAAIAQRTMGAALDNNLSAMVNTLEHNGAYVRYLNKQELEAWGKAIALPQVQALWVEKQKNEGVEHAAEMMQKVGALLEEINR